MVKKKVKLSKPKGKHIKMDSDTTQLTELDSTTTHIGNGVGNKKIKCDKDNCNICNDPTDEICDKCYSLEEEMGKYKLTIWEKTKLPFRILWGRIGDKWDDLKYFIQRGKNGYAKCDLWSMDDYLARIIVEMIFELRTNGNTLPYNMTEKEWNNTLGDIMSGFRMYTDRDKFINGLFNSKLSKKEFEKILGKYRKEYEEKMMLLIKNFKNLWD